MAIPAFRPNVHENLNWLVGFIGLASLAVFGWAFARLVLVILADPGYDFSVKTNATGYDSAEFSDYTMLQRATPFDRRIPDLESAGGSPVDAPDTTLNMTLHGVLMRQDTGGVAYISVGQAPQASYKVGDRIDAAGGAEIMRILPDVVLIERNGRRERLVRAALRVGDGIVTLGAGRVDEAASTPLAQAGDDRTGQAPGSAQPATPQTRQAEPVRSDASVTRAELEQLATSVRLEDATGEFGRGFRVFPTRDAQLFQKAGLRPGDVVQTVDGIALSSLSDFETALSELEMKTELDVQLIRGRELRLVTLRLGDN